MTNIMMKMSKMMITISSNQLQPKLTHIINNSYKLEAKIHLVYGLYVNFIIES